MTCVLFFLKPIRFFSNVGDQDNEQAYTCMLKLLFLFTYYYYYYYFTGYCI